MRYLQANSPMQTLCSQADFDNILDAPILRVAAPDVPAIPASEPLESFYMPNVEKTVEALKRILQY